MRIGNLVLRLGSGAVLAASAWAAPGDRDGFFNTRAQPLLAAQCFSCHRATQMGGLQLDSREHALKGGKSGPAVVPGNPDQSLLIRAVSYTDERLKMPPQGKLSQEQIAD